MILNVIIVKLQYALYNVNKFIFSINQMNIFISIVVKALHNNSARIYKIVFLGNEDVHG